MIARYLSYILGFILYPLLTSAQYAVKSKVAKPPVTFDQLGRWSYLNQDNFDISDGGNYFFYQIANRDGATTTVCKTDLSWKKSFDNAATPRFTAMEKGFYIQSSDTLFYQALGTDASTILPGIKKWDLYQAQNDEWLITFIKDSLYISNLYHSTQRSLDRIVHYFLDTTGKRILVEQGHGPNEQKNKVLSIELANLQINALTTKEPTSTLAPMPYGSGKGIMIFCLVDTMGQCGLYLYNHETGITAELLNNHSAALKGQYQLVENIILSKNQQWIFFPVKRIMPVKKVDPAIAQVDVWSFRDATVQPEQRRKELAKQYLSYWGVMDLQGKNLSILEDDTTQILTPLRNIPGNHLVLVKNLGTPYWWKLSPGRTFELFDLTAKTSRVLPGSFDNFGPNLFSISPNDKYVVYFDLQLQNYICYNTATHQTHNTTAGIPVSLCNNEMARYYPPAVSAVAAWGKSDSFFLVYDEFDIWKVDPAGVIPPMSITNGHGRKNAIKFRFMNGPQFPEDTNYFLFDEKEQSILLGFNHKTKDNGFYRLTHSGNAPPAKLYMGPETYFRVSSQTGHFASFNSGTKPKKAAHAEKWLVCRNSVKEAPNLYLSDDLTQFRQLTDVNPHASFNWLTSELVTWKLPDGKNGQGILYKPENFDSARRYPIIFHFYEKMSQRLNEYPTLNYGDAEINIPWFVSRGYLVFTPDIYYSRADKTGISAGKSALISVSSAIQSLQRRSYIDQKRMGIQGHSFGGMETNYIITHSNYFVAACEAAGVSNSVSSYLSLAPMMTSEEHAENLQLMEMGHAMYGSPIWSKKETYLDNSAILFADKVSAPLLIMHNKQDNQINFNQGVQLYQALRRLQKPVWLLQYDQSSHGNDGKDMIDYTHRVTQFFDHYLLRNAPPVWMTKGIPAAAKGTTDGLAPDKQGSCYNGCKICQGKKK